MLLIDPLCKRQILLWLILVCWQDWCFMEQGKSLGGAEAGLAGGTDQLRDASALLTEHGDATKLEGGRDELAEIIRNFPLFVIPLLVLLPRYPRRWQSGTRCWTSPLVSTAWHWGSQLDWTSLRLVGAGDTGWAEVVEAGWEDEGEAMGCENCRTLEAARGHH